MIEALWIAASYGGLGIVLAIIGYFAFDIAERRIDFSEEIRKGNVAAAIVVSAFLLGVCYIIGRAIGS